LKGIKEFVKIAGIPKLEEYLQEVKKEAYQLQKYFIRKSRK